MAVLVAESFKPGCARGRGAALTRLTLTWCREPFTLPIRQQSPAVYKVKRLLMYSPAASDTVELMYETGWTDGLPVVTPTRDRVRQFTD